MKKIFVYGGNKVNGDVKISGSKNSSLSIIISSLLSNEDILIKNIPNIKDINVLLKILKLLGSKINFINSNLYINNKNINKNIIPLYLSKLIRSSINIIPSILLRFGEVKISFPGGCNFCKRPIDLHIKVFKDFNIKIINLNKKYIELKMFKKITNKKIYIKKISVGVTLNAIFLSVLSYGKFIINNVSTEPEVIDTINFLNTIGANINIINNTLIIYGVKKLYGGVYKVLSDRIETGTFLLSCVLNKGSLYCLNTNNKYLTKIIDVLKISGANIKTGNDYIYISMYKKHKPVTFSSNVYPEFPTDLQPIFTNLNIINNNKISYITENIFFNRFSHVNELINMGANIKILSNFKILCTGVNNIFGKTIYAKDLRCSMSLILAGTYAIGQSVIIDKGDYIDRGYENIFYKLKSIGINILYFNYF
ncbi:UDP-N-acetylglucosamine 1-carboxyvinyltransferase [endosymbiont of Euscepes postfasciatus]|uniref:UDP-N-acetylglucosamine 1-carboxyvinyltransferase n=1 Tax=endosymbiont of Euscepes postfasciatus TaxID=650377 RepID=UPI000DC70E61|nr:UDP-N-acetylglucosamine 1-carboxyvinyltransferase [endosymbiont of Euscepes postfasciatus]BBA84609.1 UDP-N-acetylglucosamine 1-carboxyvinyltransferase [endosymbiont of Euscepes postfasciatus]